MKLLSFFASASFILGADGGSAPLFVGAYVPLHSRSSLDWPHVSPVQVPKTWFQSTNAVPRIKSTGLFVASIPPPPTKKSGRKTKETSNIFSDARGGKGRSTSSIAPRPDVVEVTPEHRFNRVASTKSSNDEPVLITIHGKVLNMTEWVNSHPGGAAVLKRFHGKDATSAFDAARHSQRAYGMLEQFMVDAEKKEQAGDDWNGRVEVHKEMARTGRVASIALTQPSPTPRRAVWRTKLFTHEDPRGIHKTLGVYCLLHFVYRFSKTLFGDPSAGFGSRLRHGRGVSSILPILMVLPHGILSLSSLIFHTVPRERVVGKPMIWKEFRAHNIIFGLRSVICTVLAWLSIYHHHVPSWRRVALLGSSLTVLGANAAADVATEKLRENNLESTTATMPYWEGCSLDTQRRFKSFYAYSQFLATISCLTVGNPMWPFSVMLAIQLASLLMTLVRKGIITAKAYHYAYTAALVMPYVMVARHTWYMRSFENFNLFGVGYVLFKLRRRGVSKYGLWLSFIVGRLMFGDRLLSYDIW